MFDNLTDFLNLDILSIIGILITVAFLGSKAFQRLGVPQVVGFIVVGTLCGSSFLNIIPQYHSSGISPRIDLCQPHRTRPHRLRHRKPSTPARIEAVGALPGDHSDL
jgi:hypothetical protein